MSSFLSCQGQINIFYTFPLFAGSAILSTSAMSVIKKQPSVARNLSLGSHASTTCSSFVVFCLPLGSDSTPSSFNIPSKRCFMTLLITSVLSTSNYSGYANHNYRKIKQLYLESTFVDPQSQNPEAFLQHQFFPRTQLHLALSKLLSIRLDHSSFHHYFGSGEPVWQVFLSPVLGLCTDAKMWRGQALNLELLTIALCTLQNYIICVYVVIYRHDITASSNFVLLSICEWNLVMLVRWGWFGGKLFLITPVPDCQ